jgi:hypothetical protein
MPRDSGKLYSGYADGVQGNEGRISITIEDKTYSGTWVATVSDAATGTCGAAAMAGRAGLRRPRLKFLRGQPEPGARAKALLSAADGSGLRCDSAAAGARAAGSAATTAGASTMYR